jgi:GNAT superfamily N-acetyltransferase
MHYAHESYTNIKDEIKPLLEQHYQEIALDQDVIKLNPDWDAYAKYDSIHALRCYTARNDDGDLVGYFVLMVSTSLHYKDHLFANNDVIFLRKDARKGMTGVKLIKYAVKCLQHEGITRININTKTHQPFDVVVERLGFELIERVYSLVLR